ncbi:MAG TPA: hypothetical protein VHZ74_16470 [Bryobacteraceae bacterium]|jgi:hypothetical protein|nr:hypothetical protein [Bryobacteraceae bacterium]
MFGRLNELSYVDVFIPVFVVVVLLGQISRRLGEITGHLKMIREALPRENRTGTY